MKKPVVLIFPFDLMSHYFRCLKIAEYLTDRFEVIVRNSEKYAWNLSAAGIKTFECPDLNADEALEKTSRFDFSWLNENNLTNIFRDQVATIEKFRPAFVIGDTSFSLKMAAEAAGVPLLSVLNGYNTRYYRYTRTLTEAHPATRILGRLPAFLYHPALRMGEAWHFRRIHNEFLKVRAKYRLKPSKHYLDELTGDKNLIVDLPQLFPQKKLPANFIFTGPLFYNHGNGIADDAIRVNPSKKTILITSGSMRDWSLFESFNRMEYQKFNIIAVGDPNNSLNAPFIIKVPFVNLENMLPKVNLVICHGGNGIINYALKHQVPVLCHAFHMEQAWNVKRIEQLGYGQSISGMQAEEIFATVEKWLNKTSVFEKELNFDSYNEDFQRRTIGKIAREISGRISVST